MNQLKQEHAQELNTLIDKTREEMQANLIDKNVEITNLEEEVQRLLLHNEALMKEKDELFNDN